MSATRAGTRPCARKAPVTFRRRSCCVNPRWRGDPLALVRSDRRGSSHSAASSLASRSAAWCPRFSLRSGSPGTNATHAASGRATDSRTTAAAQPASRRKPRSFHATTTGGRRTPAQRGHVRRRAAARRTLHSGARARPSARRSARRAAARFGAASRCSQRRLAPQGKSRRGSAEAGADRARHHARAACVTCLCQLGEYSARSGKPRLRRIRLSASSSWFASPMSNH